jgi:hypothetical protein
LYDREVGWTLKEPLEGGYCFYWKRFVDKKCLGKSN